MSKAEVFALRIPKEPRFDLSNLKASFSDAVIQRVDSFKFEKDQTRSLLSNAFIRHLLYEKAGLIKDNFCYKYSQNGKPIVVNSENFHFNLSHSGDWIVCVLDTDEVGIDIEKKNSINLSEVQYLLAKNEKTLIQATPFTERASLFYSIWTAKESYLKALGYGISGPIPPSALEVRFGPLGIVLVRQQAEVNNWSLVSMKVDPDYSLTVCTRSKNVKKEVTIIDIQDIIDANSHSKL